MKNMYTVKYWNTGESRYTEEECGNSKKDATQIYRCKVEKHDHVEIHRDGECIRRNY